MRYLGYVVVTLVTLVCLVNTDSLSIDKLASSSSLNPIEVFWLITYPKSFYSDSSLLVIGGHRCRLMDRLFARNDFFMF